MGTLKASPTAAVEMNEEEQTHLKYASESNIDDAVDMTEPGLRRIAKCNDDFTSTEDSWSPSAGHWSQEDVRSSLTSGHSLQKADLVSIKSGDRLLKAGQKAHISGHQPQTDGHWSFTPGHRLPKLGHTSKSGHFMQSQEHIYDSIDYDAMDDYEDPDKDLLEGHDKKKEEDENIYEEPIHMQSPDYLTLHSLEKSKVNAALDPRLQMGARAGNLMQQWFLRTKATVSSSISDNSSDYLTLKCPSRQKSRKLPNLPNSGPPSGGFGTRLEEHESGFFSYPEPNQLYHWDPPIPPLAEEEEQQHITSIPISSRRGTHAQCGPQWVTVNGRRFARGVIREQVPVPPPRRRRPKREVSQKTVIPITGRLRSQSQDSGMMILTSQNRGRFVQSLKISGDKPGFTNSRNTRGSIQEETFQARTHETETFSLRGRGGSTA